MPDPATLHEIGWIIGEVAALVTALALFFKRAPPSPPKKPTRRSKDRHDGVGGRRAGAHHRQVSWPLGALRQRQDDVAVALPGPRRGLQPRASAVCRQPQVSC
jgi:hypothetical protein